MEVKPGYKQTEAGVIPRIGTRTRLLANSSIFGYAKI